MSCSKHCSSNPGWNPGLDPSSNAGSDPSSNPGSKFRYPRIETINAPCTQFVYVFIVEKSITVETSVQYSIQKYEHLRADRVMTANIKSLVFFFVIMTPFPFYKNMLNFSG